MSRIQIPGTVFAPRNSFYLIAVQDLHVLLALSTVSELLRAFATRFKEVIQKRNYIFTTIFSLDMHRLYDKCLSVFIVRGLDHSETSSRSGELQLSRFISQDITKDTNGIDK